MQRSAYANAISSLTEAINLLQKVPNSPERMQRELRLQQPLSAALFAVKGWAAPETARACTLMLQICECLGDPPEAFDSIAPV